jgi:glycosyltransferase involved in cell wall biosynthesis
VNILYLSKILGNPWAGTTYAVPERIKAQAKYDNVFWLNLNARVIREWSDDKLFHNLASCSSDLDKLPCPFNNPDLVVVQQFYDYPFSKAVSYLQKKRLPYIIVPHGEMNDDAQKEKKWKKFLGNVVWFDKMVRKSVAIEYLSENEYLKSTRWKQKRHLIIPNGVSVLPYSPKSFSKEGVNAVFIGRLALNHKGIDVLLNGMCLVKEKLMLAHFKLNMYGPDKDNSKDLIVAMIKKCGLEEVVKVNEPVYGDTKREILKNSDLFVLTSRYEGMPMGLLEAMALGVPCIVTPGTNMIESVISNNAGWGTECNADSVANALVKIIDEKEMWVEKSRNAYNLASLYSWDAIAKKAHSEYEQLLNEMACTYNFQ